MKVEKKDDACNKRLSCDDLKSGVLYLIHCQLDKKYNGSIGFIPAGRNEFVLLYFHNSLDKSGGGAWNNHRDLTSCEFVEYTGTLTLSN